MPIERDIISAVETRLQSISTANGYNLDFKTIETRDHNIDPSKILDADCPIALIRYGRAGDHQRGFTDVASVGRVREMLAIDIRVILYDDGIGDTITLLTANAHEDIKRAVGDNLKTDVGAVYEAFVGAPQRPYDTWHSPQEVIDFPCQVWHEYEQRAIVTPPPSATTLVLPKNLTLSVANRELAATWELDGSAVAVNIWREDELLKANYTNAPTGVTHKWYDSDWEAHYRYRFESIDLADNTLSTAWLKFPYYPVYTPEANYYLPNWQIGRDKIGQIIPGESSPEIVLEDLIRSEIELRMLDNGPLAGLLNGTARGPLTSYYLDPARLPLAHIYVTETFGDFYTGHKHEYTIGMQIDVLASADTASVDIIEGPKNIRLAMHVLREMVGDKHTWDGVMGTITTDRGRITGGLEAQTIGGELMFVGSFPFEIIYQWEVS